MNLAVKLIPNFVGNAATPRFRHRCCEWIKSSYYINITYKEYISCVCVITHTVGRTPSTIDTLSCTKASQTYLCVEYIASRAARLDPANARIKCTPEPT